MVFRSMADFERHYFPKEYRERRIAKMTSAELGVFLAQEALELLRSRLTNLLLGNKENLYD